MKGIPSDIAKIYLSKRDTIATSKLAKNYPKSHISSNSM